MTSPLAPPFSSGVCYPVFSPFPWPLLTSLKDNERGPFATVVNGLEDLASTATSDRNSIIDEDRRGREPKYTGRDARNIDKAISDLFDRAKELSERVGDESRLGRLFSNVGSKVGRGLERWGDAVYEVSSSFLRDSWGCLDIC